MKKKILIYDDEQQQREAFKKKLKRGLKKAGLEDVFDVKTLAENKLQTSMEILRTRQECTRDDRGYPNECTSFDDTSIFIIDYDLLKSGAQGFFTGENLAYSVRCFSKCKLIVGLNQFGNNTFDLTLRGHPESFADLNLGADQLDNPGLWRGDWGDSRRGFRPWYWPNLYDSLRDFDQKVEDVQQNLKSPICKVLGFNRELFRLLPRAIVQFIGKSERKDLTQTTFHEFISESGNGLRPKDAHILDKEVLARVGAARISKWLERFVLPEQDILVDAPHLVSRYPSLIVSDERGIESWNRTAQLVNYRDLGLDTELIEPYRFKRDHWISRPAWVWDKLRECKKIKEISEPWVTSKPDWVFCEDASRFYNRNASRDFLADTVSPFVRRFASRGFKNVDYRPRLRFSL